MPMESKFGSLPSLQLQPFSKLLEKATTILGIAPPGHFKAPALDGEIVYSKNNVCVHQAITNKPIPGYLSLRCSTSESSDSPSESTLILHWLPNATICSNPRSLDSPSPKSSPRNSGIDQLTSTELSNLTDSGCVSKRDDSTITSGLSTNTNSESCLYGLDSSSTVPESGPGPAPVEEKLSDLASSSLEDYEVISLTEHMEPVSCSSTLHRYDTLPLDDDGYGYSDRVNDDVISLSSGSTEGPDTDRSCSPISELSSICEIISLTETAETIAKSHNLLFPADAEALETPQKQSPSSPPKPSVFSVNLGAMRSLRLFFSEESTSCGQLVIASRESQYKIFHFYNGGLDKLAEILEDWNLFQSAKHKRWRKKSGLSPLTQQFSVVKPKIGDNAEVHPEDCLYQTLTPDSWKLYMNERGQISDENTLKKTIFFGGLSTALKREVWPFLLQYYPYDSTFEERDQIRNDRYLQYQKIKKKREKLSKNEVWFGNFWRTVQNTVEKDVVRTDRAHVYYKGEGNANVDTLKQILLNYAVAHPHLGYTQGMSDLLSPILAEVKNESDAYWCFVGLMQKTIFVSTPRDADMDRQLLYLKELLRILFPQFYNHLMKVGDGLGLLFVHRWILLCFKREFNEQDAMSVWESCWTNIQTDYFHLFVALAVITSYSDDVLQHSLPADEMLLHFSNLAHHMNGKLILQKARSLMHQFRLLEKIPCTVQGLCVMSHTGMWDSGHVPAIECVGHEDIDGCPSLGVSLNMLSIENHRSHLVM